MIESPDYDTLRAMEQIANRIRHIRTNILGLSQEGFGKLLGVTRGAVGNWELGGNVGKDSLLQISEKANVSLDWLTKGEGRTPLGKPLPLQQFIEASDEDFARPPPPPLPVYAAAEGGEGYMVVSTEPIDYVSRPWFLEHSRGAYAVLVVGESMEPAFGPGDMALVNPRLPAIPGRDALFVASKDDGDFRAVIKRLVRSLPEEYLVNQFNPPKEIKLNRNEWIAAYRIVGKYTGG